MKNYFPILSIDYGEKHFGLAISDSKGIIASPLEVLSITKNRNREDIIIDILNIAQEQRVKSILVGIPQSFTEAQQKTVKKVEEFIDTLSKKTDLHIFTIDESFSTINAQDMLISSGQNTRSSRKKIDKIASTVFLQEFLNSFPKED